jgi:hypothetical protein
MLLNTRIVPPFARPPGSTPPNEPSPNPDPAVRYQAVREAAEIVQAAYREVVGD